MYAPHYSEPPRKSGLKVIVLLLLVIIVWAGGNALMGPTPVPDTGGGNVEPEIVVPTLTPLPVQPTAVPPTPDLRATQTAQAAEQQQTAVPVTQTAQAAGAAATATAWQGYMDEKHQQAVDQRQTLFAVSLLIAVIGITLILVLIVLVWAVRALVRISRASNPEANGLPQARPTQKSQVWEADPASRSAARRPTTARPTTARPLRLTRLESGTRRNP